MTARGIVGFVLAVASTAAVIGGLTVVGSPAESRLRRLDERRVSDLNALNSQVRIYWDRQKKLPPTLHDAQTSAGWSSSSRDPGTGEPYGYRAIDDREFELCATFDRPSEVPAYPNASFSSHPAGRQCFPLEVQVPHR